MPGSGVCIRSQAAYFGPWLRSRFFAFLNVAHYASGCKKHCGLARNQNLPPVTEYIWFDLTILPQAASRWKCGADLIIEIGIDTGIENRGRITGF